MENVDQSPDTELEEGEFVPGLALTNVDDDDDDRAPESNNNVWICEICSKEFNSKKSLGGHMRVHSQPRHLKSAKKPPKTMMKTEGSRSCRVCDKRFSSLKSLWGHMRCHPDKSLKSGDESEVDDDDEAYGAVYALMLLATGEERYRQIRSKEFEEEDERISNSTKRKRKEEGVYECEVCGKCFGSYQALGGHRSSAHSKKEKAMMNAEVADNGGRHVCKICEKEFGSGQALGGHQRRHWRGSSSSSTADGGDVDGGGRSSTEEGKSVVLDVDLNELPPEYGDGDGDGDGDC